MNSKEFSHLVSQNYEISLNPLLVDNFALVVQNEVLINTNNVAFMEPLLPATLAHIQEHNRLIENSGSIRQDLGPIGGNLASSQGSRKGGSQREVNSNLAKLNVTIVSTNLGTPLALVIASHGTDAASTASLKNLQDNFVVHKGVLSLVNTDFNTNTHKGETR
ncbi:hypothetical protein AgCh_027966 [Apium graveolens]